MYEELGFRKTALSRKAIGATAALGMLGIAGVGTAALLNKVHKDMPDEMPRSREEVRQSLNIWNDMSADEKRKWFDYNLTQDLTKNPIVSKYAL